MTQSPDAPILLSAAILSREDGRVLLVRHPSSGPFGGLWTLPFTPVGARETAEDALQRVMLDLLHLQPGPCEFSDTIYLHGGAGQRFVVNAFTCVGWGGEPRYSDRDYQDAAWVSRPPADMPLPEGLRGWFDRAFDGEDGSLDPAALDETLTRLREELVEAFEAIPEGVRDEPLDGTWSPLDVLAHAADVEAYYIAETRRLLEIPGHTWRPFNEPQWEEARRVYRAVYGPEDERMVRARLQHVRSETRPWLDSLTAEQLAAYGNHPERGVVQVAERVQKLTCHEREHLDQLRAMANATRLQAQADGPE
jgi:ADP-ribose pyrophosphatase YjhB (NUDIX family)